MTTLTFKLSAKDVRYLVRHEQLSGGPAKEADSSIFIHALPTPPARPRTDGSKPEYSVGLMDAMANCASAQRVPVFKGTNVFVKWGSDKERVKRLLHESRMYSKELIDVQGKLVPKHLGTYVDKKENPGFVVIVLEHLSGRLSANDHEVNRQTMVLIGKMHAAGINHKQLVPLDAYDHIIPSQKGLRMVDFAYAQKHKCQGCPPLVPGDFNALKDLSLPFFCNELVTLESELGELDVYGC